MMKTLYSLVAIVVCLAYTSCAAAQTKDIVVKNAVVFGSGGDEKLQLNIAYPTKIKGSAPAIVCFHGGGWRLGHRNDLNKLINRLAKAGFVALTASYRLAPKHKFPAQIHDCKAAVRWLRANAKKYNVNADKIGAIGFSAGAHLACLLGSADKNAKLEGDGGNELQSSRVQAVVSFFGPTDFTEKNWDEQTESFFFIPFLGVSFEKNSAPYKKCSPIIYVTKDDPPFLFIHGTKDKLVPIAHSHRMLKSLRKAGVSAKLITMENEAHGWGGAKLERTIDQSIEFFREKLSK